ncbi:site-specific integrase [bacterium]|nr:site-specific integrase [bacterium]
MATIENRITSDGKKSFRVKIRLRGYPIQSATFERLTDARKWVQQTESAIREGRHFKTSEAKRHTLSEMIDRYIRDELPKKPRSLRNQKTQLLWWKERIGTYLLSDVTTPLIVSCRDKLASEPINEKNPTKLRTPATINRYLAALSHVFTIAVKEWGWVEDSPLRKVSKPKEPRGRVRFLADDERERLLIACKESSNPYLYNIVVLCLSTGARKMEILSLRWKQVDFYRGVIVLDDTKNGDRRVLPLTGLALGLMKAHSKVRNIESDLVFPSGQKPQKPVEIKKAWEAALAKAKIENFRFHDLRHSTASYLAMNGATLAEIAEVLGHKTLQMVRRYSHLSEAHTIKVVANMNAKIFG